MTEKKIRTKLPDLEIKTRIYKLLRPAPAAYFLKAKGDKLKALTYFDRENKVNRSIRYASNQLSPFEDEQDNNPTLEPIIFEDGMLIVPENKPLLQTFLAIHPLNGTIFKEVDPAAEAENALSNLSMADEADDAAKDICRDIDLAVDMYPHIIGRGIGTLSPGEIKLAIRQSAKADPARFLRVISQFEVSIESKIENYLNKNLIQWRKNQSELFFQLPTNKKKILTVPDGESPMETAVDFFNSDEGVEAIRQIEKVMATL